MKLKSPRSSLVIIVIFLFALAVINPLCFAQPVVKNVINSSKQQFTDNQANPGEKIAFQLSKDSSQ